MKKVSFLFVIFMIAACCGPRDGVHTLTICATTDIHGAYFDSLYDGTLRKSSLSNVSHYIKELRKTDDNIVLIDVGDNIQGDPAAYYFNFVDTNEHVFSRIAKYLVYDAIVVGNHDLEAGHPVYDKFRKDVGIPYLAANAIVTEGENKGKSYFEPYTIVERDGLKVAIIGMTNACVKMWINAEKYAGMDFIDIRDNVQNTVNEVIERESPHLMVLALHSGVGKEISSEVENVSRSVAATVKGVDIVFCGHDHRPFADTIENPSGNVILLDGGSRAMVLSHCEAKLETIDGKVVSKEIKFRMVNMEDVEKDEEYNAKFASDFQKVNQFANKQIGQIKEPIYFADALYGPSSYLDLIHKVQLESSKADVSFAAPLSTKGEIKAGIIKYLSLASIYPYENQLYVIKMTGQQIKNYLEYSYNNWVKEQGPSFNYDSASGLDYTVSKSAPDGERVKIEKLSSGEPFDLEKSYKVAMTSYRASGAGNMLKKGAGIDSAQIPDLLVDIFPEIRVLLNDYFVTHKEIIPKQQSNWSFVR